MRFDGATAIDLRVEEPEAFVGRMLGICFLRLEHTRTFGLNADHPTLAGWQRDELSFEGEAPCGSFVVRAGGSLEPVNAEDSLHTILSSGWYNLGIEGWRGDEEQPLALRLHMVTRRIDDARCGGGLVDGDALHLESCDDGNALEGFQDVTIHKVFWGEDQVDGFRLEEVASDLLEVEVEEPGAVLCLYAEGASGEALFDVDAEACVEGCAIPVEQGQSHLVEIASNTRGEDYSLRLSTIGLPRE